MKHRILPVLTLLTLLIAPAGCGTSVSPERAVETVQKPSGTTAVAAEKQTKAAEKQPPTATQQAAASGLYEQIRSGLAAQETSIRFAEVIPLDTVQEAVDQVLSEHPELFWVQRWSCMASSSWTELEIDSEYSYRELTEMNEQLEAAVQEIVAQVPQDADPYAQALFVHDYLAAHTSYDQEGAQDLETSAGVTVYDCLVGHKAVCSGYSRAYQLLMQRLGFSCGVCSGMSRGISHAWNYIQIDGKYYWVDVTFDDPILSGETPDEDNLEHCYFMMNDEMLLRTRTMGTDDLFVPVCDSMEQNYYIRNGAYLETYSPEGVDAILAREAGQHRAEIMFGTPESYEEAKTDLLERENIWSLGTIQSSGGSNLHYQLEEDMQVLILFF